MEPANENVVPLRKTPERMIWICACGCSTFELSSDGTAQCAFCHHTREADGGWLRQEMEPEWDGDAPVANVRGNGSVEFARRVTAKRAMADDAVTVVVIRNEGNIHVWSDLETDEQVAWAKRRLDDASRLLGISPPE